MGVMEIPFAAIHIRRPVPDVARDRAALNKSSKPFARGPELEAVEKTELRVRVQGQERTVERMPSQ